LANDNAFYHNNFMTGGYPQLVEYDPAYPNVGNVFSLPLPVGGNYWSTSSCSDANHDGICDSSVLFQGGVDELPWSARSGWVGPGVAGPDQFIECPATQQVNVTLNGSGSSDPNAFLWTWSDGTNTYTATGPAPTITLPFGGPTMSPFR